jgi:hypothetical protein
MSLEFRPIDKDWSRAKVPGGWLVQWFGRQQDQQNFSGQMPVSLPPPQMVSTGPFSGHFAPSLMTVLTFVPDPNHTWDHLPAL